MLSKFNLKELMLDGFSEIRVSQSWILSILCHVVLPLLLSLICTSFNTHLDNDIISNIISSISIFSGLLFSVIFIAIENYSKRKSLLTQDSNEEVKNYLTRYKEFTKQITTLILFSVAIAIISVVFLLVYLFLMKANLVKLSEMKNLMEIELININYSNFKNIILIILQMLSFIFLFNYLLIIVALIKEVYAMIFDSINFNT